MSNGQKDPTPIDGSVEDASTAPEPSGASTSMHAETDATRTSGVDAIADTPVTDGTTAVVERGPDPVDPKPLIEAMEALSRGLRTELQLAKGRSGGGTLPEHGAALAPLIEAAEVQIRRVRSELALAEEHTDPNDKSGATSRDSSGAGRLGPLIEVFEAQIRGIRNELSQLDPAERDGTAPRPLGDSWAPAPPVHAAAEPPASAPPSDRDDHDRRRTGGLVAAATLVGVVAAATWLAWPKRSREPLSVDRIAAPQSVPAEGPKTTPTPGPAAESSPSATAAASRTDDSLGTSGSGKTTSSALVESRSSVRAPRDTRSRVAPPEPVTIKPSESSSHVNAVASATTPDSFKPSTTPETVPEAGSSPASLSEREAIAKPDAGSGPPGERTAPATTTAALLTRPATVLTRVQPRRLVEVLSGEMSAVVDVQVSVNSEGRPYEVRAVSGPVALRAPAEDTVRRWTFSPALQAGEPVDGTLRVSVTFGPWVRDMRFRRRAP